MEKGSCSEGISGARDSRRLKHSLAGDLLRLLRSALARRLLVLLEAILTFVYREESGRVGEVFIFSFLSFRSSSSPRRFKNEEQRQYLGVRRISPPWWLRPLLVSRGMVGGKKKVRGKTRQTATKTPTTTSFLFFSEASRAAPRRAASPPPLSQRSPKIPFSLFPASTRVACISSSVFPVPDIVFF